MVFFSYGENRFGKKFMFISSPPLYRVFRALYSEIYDPRFGDQTGAASARMLYALSLFRKK